MTRVKITTPVPDHDGVVGKVFITQGVGYADSETHAAEIAYCRANGYTVTDLDDQPDNEPVEHSGPEQSEPESSEQESSEQEEASMPRRSGSAEAWREYAIARGMSAEEAQSLTRDQLVERFTTSTEEEA
jgi:hypothetical protein